jgi:hypothetical protein
MDGKVSSTVQDRGLNLSDEHSLAAHLPDGDVEPAITSRLDDEQLDRQTGVRFEKSVSDELRLPFGELAAPSRDAQSARHLEVEENTDSFGQLLRPG